MATATKGGPEMPPSEDALNAHEFAVRRLAEAEEPIQPNELAGGYECSNGHMRSVLCDLVEDGEAVRVAHGWYVHPDSADEAPSNVGYGPVDPEGQQEGMGGSGQNSPETSGAEETGSDHEEGGEADADSVEEQEVETAEVAAAGAATAASAGPALLDREFATSTLAVMGVAVIVTVAFLLVWDGPGEEEPDDDLDRGEGVADPSGDFTEAFES